MSNEELSRDEKLVRAVQERYHNMLEQGVDPYEWAYAWRSEINRGGFKAVDFLMREIVDTGKCVGCAACVTICPTDVFDYKDEHPRRHQKRRMRLLRAVRGRLPGAASPGQRPQCASRI